MCESLIIVSKTDGGRGCVEVSPCSSKGHGIPQSNLLFPVRLHSHSQFE